MTTFIFGALGALLTLAIAGVFFYLGWRLGRRTYEPPARVEAPELTERQQAERRRLEEDIDHFHNLMSYSAEMAYGLNEPGERLTMGSDTR